MEHYYDYRPRWTVIILCALFFGAGALMLGAKAHGNDRGLIINGLILLSPSAATIFLWVMAALSAGFVVLAVFLAFTRFTLRQRIVVTHTSLTAPRGRWSREEVTVPFSDVLELTPVEISGQRFLKIVYQGGKFTLTASMLPRKQDFDEICEILTQGVKSCRT